MSKIAEGTRLGRYEIRSLIGAGGMGEVYLARDTQLDRVIALKLLPPEVASNEERMRRFNQEARSAAALNHPNIAHIYEIGEAEGTHFIAMEYVDGASLHEKIQRRKTPLRKLLKYLTQVAEGLAKAHAAGIVHRDLKPENIMIAREDYAKILDFGLAKLLDSHRTSAERESSGESNTAILPQHSIPGMVMGTAGYMSPEQAQGNTKEIDHRTDIFSFGCILFEAVTGQKAFGGKDALDSLYKIVHAPTPQILEVNPGAPPELQRIVRRCLAKEPDKRYQSIKDVAIELDELRQELKDNEVSEFSVQTDTDSATPPTRSQQYTSATRSSPATASESRDARTVSSAEYLVTGIRQHKFGFVLVSAIILVAISGIGFAIYKYRTVGDGAPRSIKIEKLTTEGKTRNAAISPDGKYAVYNVDEGGRQSLWTKQLATSSTVQIIPPGEGVEYHGMQFTPDGNFVTVIKRDTSTTIYSLYQMPALGGTQKKLVADVDGAISYSPDGKQFSFIRGNYPEMGDSAVMIANADGTGERVLAKRRRPETFPWWPGSTAWSPDGKTIACVIGGNATGGVLMEIVEVNAENGSMEQISKQGWYEIKQLAWMPDKSGLLVIGAEKASDFHTQQISYMAYPTGELRRVTTDFNNYFAMSLTADGKSLTAVQGSRISNIWIAPNLEASRAVQIKAGGTNQEGTDGLAWAPDGRIVYYSKASGGDDIWIMNADGTGVKQLTIDAGTNYDLKVTPDGRYIVFTSERAGQPNIWRMDMDGGNPKQLTFGNSEYGVAVTPDSKWLIFDSAASGTPAIWKVSIDGGEPVQVIQRYTENAEISPDGKSIACEFRENAVASWRFAIFGINGGEPIKVFDLPNRETDFRWAPDGRSLVYGAASKGVTNIWSYPLDGDKPKQLTDFKNDQIFTFKWSPDGKSIVASRGTLMADMVMIRDFR